MNLTPFHAYYTARKLESLSGEDRLIAVYASSDIKVYPFQIATAEFAVRPYQKGVILCDEAGMGKSHEAMLILVQKCKEGQSKILLAVPNTDILYQWAELIERHYTVPFVILANREDWKNNISDENSSAFEQDAVILTTYNFLIVHKVQAQTVQWDVTVFEEANALSAVYEEDGRQAKILRSIAGKSFKILLTGTPIEKNIFDLYGLIYFIDETILPDVKTYEKRYLRQPENYPELAEIVSRYCFRTLRSQAGQYAKIPERIHLTYEYKMSPEERELNNLVFAYANKKGKSAMPELDEYRAVLKLMSCAGSSAAAVSSTIKFEIKKLQKRNDAQAEIAEFQKMLSLAESISSDSKAKALLTALERIFPLLKKLGANQKAVIFTESKETQKYLYKLLRDKYKTLIYNSYQAIRRFKEDGEILISTDNGARGFQFEEASFVVNYDILYNSMKMEQRIDRCHRLGQQNDVIVLSFIDKRNYADVRKLQLVNKRHLLADGVFGLSDPVLGDFTDNLENALNRLPSRLRTGTQIERDYQNKLLENEDKNRELVKTAETILFTTFTKELADRVTITPQYAEERSKNINEKLWRLVKYFFGNYNDTHDDCFFVIDEKAQTITATNFKELPYLFYYWTGSGNRKYKSLKRYGMAADFKPGYGRITLSSILARGIIHEIECGDSGKIVSEGAEEPCSMALYDVNLRPSGRQIPVFAGKTETGRILNDSECQELFELPVERYTESDHRTSNWLRTSSSYHELDRLLNTDEIIEKEVGRLTSAQAGEISRIKLKAKKEKSELRYGLNDLERTISIIERELEEAGGRLERLTLEKKMNAVHKELLQKQENQFLEEMKIDADMENQIEEFLGREKTSAKAVRQFVINLEVE